MNGIITINGDLNGKNLIILALCRRHTELRRHRSFLIKQRTFKMPFVKVYTNVKRAQVDSKRALAAFTTALAAAFYRGEAFVMVKLEPELELSMGQSTEPCAFLQVRNTACSTTTAHQS
ncbi:hypothetical protein Poli38472_008010 [Pythium oligandrum]|uniref:L-dopachrome isomerase n=1 Tax=Pythium oligandrum TaxID=41045 RepID=A0A8K1FP82_PYTOL|nr:hypothetical protein Poli38472_008010 [Pythium oligandrum]|eukprot:TMW65368.1 hypothetical protein Poli38472_008010 [Pythium oligandrum]